MAELKFPGVFIEEMSAGSIAIPGVPTSIAAFVGVALNGPLNQAIRVASFADFEKHFGGLARDLEFGYGVQQFFLNGGTDAFVVAVASGAAVAEFTGGIQALDSVDLFNLLALPGVTDPAVLAAADDCCRRRRAILIADSPFNAKTPAQMQQLIGTAAIPKTSYGAMYYPWLKIVDPLNNGQPRFTPPSGSVAGVIARTDSTHGIWKAPAGLEATLQGAQGLEYTSTDPESSQLNHLGINCLRVVQGTGPVVWGARTLEGDDQLSSEWKYIPVRRTALFIEESIRRGTGWVAFEPNSEPLWARIRLNVGAFLHGLFQRGAFQGDTPTHAYFVKCDSETTTAEDLINGVVNILVGFAPLKPAEFVTVMISKSALTG